MDAKKCTEVLRRCELCGRRCRIDRTKGERGPCAGGMNVRVSHWLAHMGEEPPLSGTKGSGTIFFCGCSLRCIFCQNAAISQGREGRKISDDRLVEIMLELETAGCHNINLVSPTHYAPQIAQAIRRARGRGLGLPIVYNTHGYDTEQALACMEGSVDIYLPDMKYADNRIAKEISGIQGYREANRAALKTMFSQVGHLSPETQTGIATRGLLVRILLLPGHLEGARASLVYLKNRFSTAVSVSLMSQYTPLHKSSLNPTVNRTLYAAEYEETVDFALSLGFRRLWLQDRRSAFDGVPNFSLENPFVF